MKERPILFSAPMVRAIQADRKTQTRRIVKGEALAFLASDHKPILMCPKGQIGDQLWVKETYFAWGRWETRYSDAKQRDEWHFIDMTAESGESYLYAADGVSNTQAFSKRRSDPEPMYWKRPSIFMPRPVSRIDLEITGVRVELLSGISDADAIAEGVERSIEYPTCWKRGKLHGDQNTVSITGFPKLAFRSLWEEINGFQSWAANPWVWVIEFMKLESAP